MTISHTFLGCKCRSKWRQEKTCNNIGSQLDQAVPGEPSWMLELCTEGAVLGELWDLQWGRGWTCWWRSRLGLLGIFKHTCSIIDIKLRKHRKLGFLAPFLGRNSNFASEFASVFVANSLGKYQLLFLPWMWKDRLRLKAVINQCSSGQHLLGGQHLLTSSPEEGNGTWRSSLKREWSTDLVEFAWTMWWELRMVNASGSHDGIQKSPSCFKRTC